MSTDDRSGDDSTDSRSIPTEWTEETELPIAVSDFFQLLANDRTRYLLFLLTERGGTIFLDELDDYFEGDDVRLTLHHHQLPRLVDFHLIDYDPATGAITLTALGDDLKPALDTVASLEEPVVNEFLLQAHSHRR